MRGQLTQILNVAQQPNVIIQVIPFASGAHTSFGERTRSQRRPLHPGRQRQRRFSALTVAADRQASDGERGGSGATGPGQAD
jgi:hypothetical protein